MQPTAFLLGLAIVFPWACNLRGQDLTLEQALDATNLVWTTGGSATWFGQTTNSHDGNGAGCCRLVGSNQESWLETRVVGPATLSYWWLLADADGASFPSFPRVNAGLMFSIYPTPEGLQLPGALSSWGQCVYDLPAGTNWLRWSFTTYWPAANAVALAFLDQVTIDPPRPLQITGQPLDHTVFSRDRAWLSLSAIGTPPISYQWLKDGTNVPGATNSWLSVESATTNDTGVYAVLVTNIQGSLISTNALLTVLPPTAPSITYQPRDETVYSGQSVSWPVRSEGSPPIEYQWRKNGTNLPGARLCWLHLENIQLNDAGVYSVEVSNAEGSVLSSNAVLTVLPSAAPVITSHPRSLNVVSGATPTLSVEISGAPAPDYQWLKNGTNLPGARFSSFWFTNVAIGDSGVYSVRVSNFVGAAVSREAILAVLPPPSPRGSWSQDVNDVFVTNNLAYLALGTNGLGVLDVSNPDNPTLLGGHDTGGYAYAVRVVGALAYVADGWSGLRIFTVTNPANPIQLGTCNTPGSAQDVDVAGNLVYVADLDFGLQIIDASDPAHPSRLGGFVTNMYAEGVCVAGNRAYVACMSQGLQIIDVSNPAQPALLAVTSQGALDVDVLGNHVVAVGPFNIFDVADSAAPVQVSLPFGMHPSLYTYDVQVVGKFAYLACGEGLQVLDVSIPSAPVIVACLATTGSAKKVCVADDRAYVVVGGSCLQILDLPSNAGVQPSPTLSLSVESGMKHVKLDGPAGARFLLEYVDNLTNSQWQEFQTITLTNIPAVVEPPSAPASQRFFRARLVQP